MQEKKQDKSVYIVDDWGILIIIPIITILVVIMFPLFSRAREEARKSTCQSSLKQISLAMTLYTQDYDGRFPTKHWNKPIFSDYMHNFHDFCPNAEDFTKPSYAMNGHLIGYVMKDVKKPGDTVMLFESVCGDDLIGGQGLLPETPRHLDGDNVSFVDGHVKFYARPKIPKLMSWK